MTILIFMGIFACCEKLSRKLLAKVSAIQRPDFTSLIDLAMQCVGLMKQCQRFY